ncbi:hypothetical protein BGZ82_002839 [Podila clonocystis]|nr:hypothetical protein BGZ82_002839 [Podila clonocystis]
MLNVPTLQFLVCQTDAACQPKTPSRTSFIGNEKKVCNKQPEAFYNTFMSCAVKEDPLSGFFLGNYTLTLDLDVKNTTVHAQLWQGPAELFCITQTCTLATLNESDVIKTKWECPTLSCSKDCDFFIADLDGVFPTGLKIVDCDLGECVFPSEMQSTVTDVDKKIALGVIVCIAILAALVAALVVICAVAKHRQLVLNRTPHILNTEAPSLEFRIVGLHFEQGGLKILKGISGSAPAGAVLVVMGPSGAAKSTLVDILARKNKGGKVTGQILLNGKQEDTLPPTQTVYDAGLFSAMMRLPEAMPIHCVHERVSEVIEMLGLTNCSNRRICNVTTRGLSGGEERRISIALELITRPLILILDEPTSGSDSHRAHMVAEQLW